MWDDENQQSWADDRKVVPYYGTHARCISPRAGPNQRKSLARFPHPQTGDGDGVQVFLPGLLAKKEMAPRSYRRSGNLL